MADVHVLADYEEPTQVTDYALMARTTALEAIYPGGVSGFAVTFDAYLVPDLETCATMGRDNIRAALRALGDLGFTYGQDMVAVEVELELLGPRAMHHLERDAGKGPSEQQLEAEIIDGRMCLRHRQAAGARWNETLLTRRMPMTRAPGIKEGCHGCKKAREVLGCGYTRSMWSEGRERQGYT